jgi:hypothetical protein
LTVAQSHIRDLQTRRVQDATAPASVAASAPSQYDQQAAAVRRGLSLHLVDVGEGLPALPEHTALGTTIPVHTTPAPADDGGTGAPAVPGTAPTPHHPPASFSYRVDSTSAQAVVSAAIGRPGALSAAGALTLAAAGPQDPPPGGDPGLVPPATQADLKSLLGTNRDPPNPGAPPSAATGSSMMPFMMPVGMGMGMSAGGGWRTASVAGDREAWDDDPKPGGGDGVLGRTTKPLDQKVLLEPLPGGSYA